MDDLIVSGAVGLVIFAIVIVLVVLGIAWFFRELAQALLTGNVYEFAMLAMVMVIAIMVYVSAGLWLRKNGTI
ncbi:MAG: hypothetical protein LUQ31_09270 [Methanoregula sp.]|nr:hypothetical protein [Methanoregula sp.]